MSVVFKPESSSSRVFCMGKDHKKLFDQFHQIYRQHDDSNPRKVINNQKALTSLEIASITSAAIFPLKGEANYDLWPWPFVDSYKVNLQANYLHVGKRSCNSKRMAQTQHTHST